ATDGGGAIDGGDDRDVVARARFAAGAFVALKRASSDWSGWRGNGLAAGIVADKIAIHEIVGVNPLARFDCLDRLADDLAILADVVARFDRTDGDFVTEANGSSELDRRAGDFERFASGQVAGGDADIVVGVQVDGVGAFWGCGNGHA